MSDDSQGSDLATKRACEGSPCSEETRSTKRLSKRMLAMSACLLLNSLFLVGYWVVPLFTVEVEDDPLTIAPTLSSDTSWSPPNVVDRITFLEQIPFAIVAGLLAIWGTLIAIWGVRHRVRSADLRSFVGASLGFVIYLWWKDRLQYNLAACGLSVTVVLLAAALSSSKLPGLRGRNTE